MENYTKYPRGSEWRKWDLHIHTPLSICQHYKNTPESWEKFINALENLPPEVKVLGITDYYFIDGYEKVMQEKSKGRLKNIDKIFPILEFRIDTFGNGHEKLQKVNLHILFNLDESNLKKEIEKVRQEFINHIPISSVEKYKTKKLSLTNFAELGGSLKDGFESLVPPTKEVLEYVNSETWKDKTFLFLGYREWSNLEKNQQLKPLKEELYGLVMAFLGNNFATNENNQKWLNEFGNKRLLHSLDIHGYEDLDTYEFDKDGNKLPSVKYHCNTWIKSDPTFDGLKQILYEPESRVAIQETNPEAKTGYQVIDRVEINNPLKFNGKIEFNPNLNSIIGGRSTGKSILLGAIAKKLKCLRRIDIHDQEYDHFILGISNTIKIFWKDGNQNDDREIEYFQQGYMNDIARNSEKLSSIVQNILSHKGKQPLLDDYQRKEAENSKAISGIISDFHRIQNDVKEKKVRVKDKGDITGIELEITKLQSDLNAMNSTEITADEKARYENLKNAINEIANEISKIQNDITIIESLKSLSLFRESIAYELTSVSPEKRKIIEEIFDNIRNKAKKEWQENLKNVVVNSSQEKADKQLDLDKSVSDQTYLKVSASFSKNAQLTEFEAKIKHQQKLLFELKTSLEEISKLESQFSELIENAKRLHKQFFNNIDSLIPQLTLTKDGLIINAKPVFDRERYKGILSSAINQQSYDNQKLANFEYNTRQGYENHVFDIFSRLLNGSLPLKAGYTNQSLINSILSSNFFKISYDIEYEGDDFKKMSDGKKAFVILKLLLDFSDKNCPILIDQPEDDLDNRAIYNDLVQYLLKKKQVRQIIVATHNPNIVVGADSELIICANQHGEKNANTDGKKFQYVSGSLEHTFEKIKEKEVVLESQGIREHVCEILEGGDIAFKLRERKYGIK